MSSPRSLHLWMVALLCAPFLGPAPSLAEEATCFPPCSPGYLCHEGACLEACNPKCMDDERCTAERICVAREPAAASDPAKEAAAAPAAPEAAPAVSPGQPAAVDAAPAGEICVYRKVSPAGAAVPFEITLDESAVRIGMLPIGRYVCTPASPGRHLVKAVFTNAMMGNPPTIVTAVEVKSGETHHLLSRMKMGFASGSMIMDEVSAANGMALQASLKRVH